MGKKIPRFDDVLSQLTDMVAVMFVNKCCKDKGFTGKYRRLDKIAPFPLVFDDKKVIFLTNAQKESIDEKLYKKAKDLIEAGYKVELVKDFNI